MSSAILIVLLALSCFLHASIVVASINSQTVISGLSSLSSSSSGNVGPALADKDKEDGSVVQSTDCVKIPMTACSATCDKADKAYQSKGKMVMMIMICDVMMMMIMILMIMMMTMTMIDRYPGMGDFVRRGPQVSVCLYVCYH